MSRGRPRINSERLDYVDAGVLPQSKALIRTLAKLTGNSQSRIVGEFIDQHINQLEDEVILKHRKGIV